MAKGLLQYDRDAMIGAGTLHFSKTTLSITTFSITTPSIMAQLVTNK
jgi:hypothetical protein